MYGFEASAAVAVGEGFTLYRNGPCMGMRIPSRVTDTVSAAWKRAMSEQFQSHKHPRFLWIDLEGAEPDNTMGERFRSVSFARDALQHIEWCALHTGRSSGSIVVLRTMLRLIGLSHFALYDDAAQWRAAVDEMKQGKCPTLPRSNSEASAQR